MQKFSLEFTKRPKTLWGAASGFVLEGDVRIASFKRKAPQSGYIQHIESKFFADQAFARFLGFTGELGIEETIEALYPADTREILKDVKV